MPVAAIPTRVPHVYSSDDESSSPRKHKRADSTSEWLPDIVLDQPIHILCMSKIEMSIGFMCLGIALLAYLSLDQLLEAINLG